MPAQWPSPTFPSASSAGGRRPSTLPHSETFPCRFRRCVQASAGLGPCLGGEERAGRGEAGRAERAQRRGERAEVAARAKVTDASTPAKLHPCAPAAAGRAETPRGACLLVPSSCARPSEVLFVACRARGRVHPREHAGAHDHRPRACVHTPGALQCWARRSNDGPCASATRRLQRDRPCTISLARRWRVIARAGRRPPGKRPASARRRARWPPGCRGREPLYT